MLKKQYDGLNVVKISFDSEFETVRVQSGCWSIMAYTQGTQGSEAWQLCQEALEAGDEDPGNYAEWWMAPKEIYP